MDVQVVLHSTNPSIDVQGVPLSTTSSVDVQDAFQSSACIVDVSLFTFLKLSYMPECPDCPASGQLGTIRTKKANAGTSPRKKGNQSGTGMI
jgi:hypothetical protein